MIEEILYRPTTGLAEQSLDGTSNGYTIIAVKDSKKNASEFLKEYFPPDVNPLPYRSVLNAETERMCQYLSRKFEMDKRLEELLSFPIVIDDSTAESMTFVNNTRSAKYAEMSSGLDSKIYFDLLCSETHHDGVYLIDQPEDNISQKAIRNYLLDRFKNMGEVRQVIMVTHNPQFIVNLDVDNLIFLSKDESGLKIRSGALEYECPEYNILDIVAQNIDGGLDSIRKRWKRYEKTSVL